MSLVILVKENIAALVEKRLHYRFHDKGRERSNRAAGMAEAGAIARRCLRHHDTIAYSGPPYDAVRAYVCLHCHGVASEPEIRDRGFEFDTIPDWEIMTIMDLDLERQAQGNSKQFYIPYK